MRLHVVLAVAVFLVAPPAWAQSAGSVPTRWEAGPATLGGPGLLFGAALARQIFRSNQYRVAAEVSALTQLWPPLEWACLQLPTGCANGGPRPRAMDVSSVGLRGTRVLSRRAYASGQLGATMGHWQYPVAGHHATWLVGFGVGRFSTNGRRTLDLQWQRFATPESPTSGVRIAWLHHW